MGDWIAAVRRLLMEFLDANQYLSLAAYVGVEEAGVPFPVPADALIMFMGYRVFEGVANPIVVVAVVVASATAGACVLYWMARLIGPRFLDRFGRFLHLTPDRRVRAERWINRNEVPAVVIGRLIPGFRIVITIVAGAARASFWVFLPSAAVSALIWALIYMGIGWALGRQYERLEPAIDADPRIGFVMLLGALVLAGSVAAFRMRRKLALRLWRRASEHATDEELSDKGSL